MTRIRAGKCVFGLVLAGGLAGLGFSSGARAGVFNLPHFVAPGEFAIGLEPELSLTGGAGLAINGRYTHGLSELSNLSGILGTGGGPRQFRLGAAMTFDFFPDIDKQPGIGLAIQALYVRVPLPGRPDGSSDTTGRMELTAIPYIHKALPTAGMEIDPFFALPIGMGFNDGRYQALSTVVIGSGFKHSEKIRSTLEFGVAINHTETYLSGGVTYYH